MNITKNPKIKNKSKIDVFLKMADINAMHLGRLLYALSQEFPKEFYPKRQKEFIDAFRDSVEYIDGVPDADIREHKLCELQREAPYIDFPKAEQVLICMEHRYRKYDTETYYKDKDFRHALIENIALMLHTLRVDFGFGEQRIGRAIGAWVSYEISDPLAYISALCGENINEGCEALALEIIEKRSYRTQKPTVREQLDAQKYMEEFRKIMEGFQ